MGMESIQENNDDIHGDASLLGREDIFVEGVEGKEQYPETQELTAKQEAELSEALKKLREDPKFNHLH